MKVLVTGHKGFIGTIMVPMLLEEGFEVQGLDSDLFRYCTYGEPPVEVPSTIKDVRDVVPADLEGFDAIIHLAALSNDLLGDINPDITLEINHKATLRIAEMAKKVGVKKFLFASSCSMYGKAGEEALDETADFNPVTHYAISKVCVERDLSLLAGDNFSPIFFRNATAYGVSPRMRFDLVINNLVAWAYTTGKIHMKSDGTPWRPLVHAADISRAFIVGLKSPIEIVHNQAFNVGKNSENYRIKELAEFVRETVPNCEISFADGAGPDERCYKVDFTKIHTVLPDFQPFWNAKLGVEDIYKSYKKYGLEQDEYEGVKYKRIAHIKYLLSKGKLDDTLRWQ